MLRLNRYPFLVGLNVVFSVLLSFCTQFVEACDGISLAQILKESSNSNVYDEASKDSNDYANEVDDHMSKSRKTKLALLPTVLILHLPLFAQ